MEERERAAEVRAAIARSGFKLYEVGAMAQIAPSYLSQMLRGRIPLSPERAAKVLRAIEEATAARG